MIFEKKNSSFTYTLFFLTYKALIAQKNQSVKERSIFFFQISKFGSFWWVVVPDKQQKVENFYFTWHESLWLGRIILVKHIPNIDIIYLGCFILLSAIKSSTMQHFYRYIWNWSKQWACNIFFLIYEIISSHCESSRIKWFR